MEVGKMSGQEATRSTVIAGEQDLLERSVKALAEVAEALETRLCSVTRPAESGAPEKAAEPTAQTSPGAWLQSVRREVSDVCERLRRLCDGVEL